MTRPPLTDPSGVTARATQIARAAQTQYWLVASLDDLLGLLLGTITAELHAQAVAQFHRAKDEGADAYLARLEDLSA